MAQLTFGYANITANTTTTVKSGPGTLHRFTVNGPGTTWVVTLWDSLAASGTKIATITVAAGQSLEYNVNFATGLTVSATGTAGDATISFN